MWIAIESQQYTLIILGIIIYNHPWQMLYSHGNPLSASEFTMRDLLNVSLHSAGFFSQPWTDPCSSIHATSAKVICPCDTDKSSILMGNASWGRGWGGVGGVTGNRHLGWSGCWRWYSEPLCWKVAGLASAAADVQHRLSKNRKIGS